MRLSKSSLFSSLFAAVSVTVLAVGIVGAQDSGSGDPQTSTAVVALQSTEDQAAYLQSLADNLGITLEQLNAAIITTNMALVDQAVTDGTLTQAQADDLKARMAEGEVFLGGRFLHGPGDHGFRGFHYEVVSGEVATFLGVTEDELRTQLQDGATLAEVADAQGKSVDELKTTITAAVKAELDARVADGTIDQARADEKLAELTDGLDDLVNGDFGRGLFDGPRGFGGPGFSDDGTDEGTEDDTAESTSATT